MVLYPIKIQLQAIHATEEHVQMRDPFPAGSLYLGS